MSENGVLISHPLDLDHKSLISDMDKRTGNRDSLIKWIMNNLDENVDYAARRGNKKNLEKPGAEKIVSATGLQPTFPSLNRYEEAAYSGIDIKEIVIRCELTLQGRIVGTGIGGRSVKEHHGNINAALKMAKKSALIDAVLTTFGLSQMFQQDWNEKDQAEQEQRRIQATKPKPTTLEEMKVVEKKDVSSQTKAELSANIFKVLDKLQGDKKAQVLDFLVHNLGNRVDTDKKTFAADVKKDELCKIANGIKEIVTGKSI